MAKDPNNQDLKIIRINSKLYDQLRGYCDLNGIRFIDFVEDSLENAFSLNELEKIKKETERLSERVKKEHKKTYLHGFKQGFCAAFYLLQGQTALSQKYTPAEVKEERNTFIPGDGKQINLFD